MVSVEDAAFSGFVRYNGENKWPQKLLVLGFWNLT